tara:strand:+ start:500 stop:664 length:165 start_codon:yes stop_codon:yes gene_type:complete
VVVDILENPEVTQDMVVLAVEAQIVQQVVQVELGLYLGTVVAQVPETVEVVEVQ